jgi:hypothetical protein
MYGSTTLVADLDRDGAFYLNADPDPRLAATSKVDFDSLSFFKSQ